MNAVRGKFELETNVRRSIMRAEAATVQGEYSDNIKMHAMPVRAICPGENMNLSRCGIDIFGNRHSRVTDSKFDSVAL